MMHSQVGMEGLEILKPMAGQRMLTNGISENIQNGFPGSEKQPIHRHGGVNMAVDIVASEGDNDDLTAEWMVENLKFSVTEPVRKFQLVMHHCCLCFLME